MTQDVSRTPEIIARVHGNGGEVAVDGSVQPLTGPDAAAAHGAVMREVVSIARQLGRPAPFRLDDNGTWWNLVAGPDGSITQAATAPNSAGSNGSLSGGTAIAVPQNAPAASASSVPPAGPASASSASPRPAQPAQPAAGSNPNRRPGAPLYGPASGRQDPPAPTGLPAPSSPSQPAPGRPAPANPGPGRRAGSMPGPAAGGDRHSWPPQPSPAPHASGPAQGYRQDYRPDPDPEPQPRHALSFLPADEGPTFRPPPPAQPQGWWSRLFGKNTEPDPALIEAQRAEAADEALVSKHWPGPKTIAVVNGKGGSGKTPTTALLAAVFARYGGGGVIAWDNNDTRGTLGWRTANGGHDRTVLDLIPDAEALMDRDAQIGRLAYYVHHQPEDKYDVLRSNPALLAQDQRLSTEQFKALHDVCNRFYRLILMDSGNDESTYAWLNMIEAADQIVVPTTTRPDHAEAGLLLLQALSERSQRCLGLTDRAVVIVSQADQDEASADQIADGFREMLPADNVVTIPYDRAIRDSQLRYDRLNPATRRAFLRAAAAVAGQL